MSSWSSSVVDTTSLSKDIEREIGQRNNAGGNIEKYQASLRVKIGHMENKLAQMEDELGIQVESYTLDDKEITKRQSQLDALRNQLASHKQKLANAPSNFGAAPARVFGETSETMNIKTDALVDLQTKKMNEQDERVAILSKQVGVIKDIGNDISDELGTHIKIIDGIETKIDKTTSRVEKQSKRLDMLRTEAATGSCWIFICILFIIIILLSLYSILV